MLGNTERLMECHPWKREQDLANRPHISMANLTNSFCVTVHLLSNKSQMSNMNKKSGAQTKIGDLVILTLFNVSPDLLLNRPWQHGIYLL